MKQMFMWRSFGALFKIRIKSDMNLFTCFWFCSKRNISQIFHLSILTSVFMCNMCCIWSICFRCIHPFTINFDDIICEDASVTPVIWFVMLLSSVRWNWASMSSAQAYRSSDCFFFFYLVLTQSFLSSEHY